MTEQDKIILSSITAVDNQYKIGISLFDAMLQGVTKERYEFAQRELSKTNTYLKESIEKGYRVILPDIKNENETKTPSEYWYFVGDFIDIVGDSWDFNTPSFGINNGTDCSELRLTISSINPYNEGVTIHGNSVNTTITIAAFNSFARRIHWHMTGSITVSRSSEMVQCRIDYRTVNVSPCH